MRQKEVSMTPCAPQKAAFCGSFYPYTSERRKHGAARSISDTVHLKGLHSVVHPHHIA